MRFISYINANILLASLRPLAGLLCVLACLVFSYAHASAQPAQGEHSYDFRVYFKYDDASFAADYLSNPVTLRRLGKVISENGTSSITQLEIIAFSSPEGSAVYNRALAERRAASMKSYLVENWPELTGKISVSAGVDCWDDFREILVADTLALDASKQEILAILDGDMSADAKKAAIWKHRDFKNYYSGYFKEMRYAAFRLTFPYAIEEEEKEEEPQPREISQIEVPAAPVLAAAPVTNAFSTPDDMANTPVVEPYRGVRWPLFAVSTNLLQDLAITPNFMIEVPIGKRWSIYGEYTFPWWLSKKNNRAWEMLKWDLGVRYWPFYKPDESDPMDILRGHFFGLDLSGGYFDVEPKHKGYQGEFIVVGLEYGYAWKLARDWRLDAFIGAGWLGSKYRYYEGDPTDKHLIYQHSGKFNWFGPTRLGVSIKYIIPYSRVKKEKKK